MMCLDSDCIIDFLKGKNDAINIIEKYKNEVITTEVSVFEIFFGIYLKKEIDENELITANNFFSSIEVFPFDGKCGHIAANILASLFKKGKSIEQNDCFIAAIMKKNKCDKIITKNEKHFSRIEGIKVINY